MYALPSFWYRRCVPLIPAFTIFKPTGLSCYPPHSPKPSVVLRSTRLLLTLLCSQIPSSRLRQTGSTPVCIPG
ncbi:hypothetical protein PYCCODRAFT_246973 [Trametes coccinea BRFM310]|uniref:Uncharacterized protein n=1 Tax=Trametes coccinea (strain BRFM310) TaxID=1353009 RepID=A0A1Y2IPX8_TRAC3|nr:hypothetical protein PYCCODRAFT_246973 [Trametes coccinea BRFM310]